MTWFYNILDGFPPSILSYSWLTITIDILVVAYCIYKLMLWIRETKAWTLFKGFMMVVIVFAAANLLYLTTIKWIIEMTFNIGLIAIVVIFQPELRKALEQLGKGKYLSFIKSSDKNITDLSAQSAEEIVKAVKVMSEAKTGALIVIEQNASIWEPGSSGIPLDSIISSQLLINIFEHNTPLHDGAVVIRHNRISAAACILPLTKEEIGKDLGTRHRAAVGVSEESDAVVLVVSEETGGMSIASGGSLRRSLSEKQIRAILLRSEKTDAPEIEKTKKKRPLTIRRHRKYDKSV